MFPWEGFVQILEGVKFQIHVMLFEVISGTLLLTEGQSLELHKGQCCHLSLSPTRANLHTVSIPFSFRFSENHRDPSRNQPPAITWHKLCHPSCANRCVQSRKTVLGSWLSTSHLFSFLQSVGSQDPMRKRSLSSLPFFLRTFPLWNFYRSCSCLFFLR